MNASAFPVENIPLIKKGDDIAGLLTQRARLNEHDIVVISSTVISKSEGRVISQATLVPTERANRIGMKNNTDPRFVQAVLDESDEILLDSPFLLVLMKNGSICVNAGIDHSNVEGNDNILLLPEDPDSSALDLKKRLFDYTGKNVSVIITDTNGRAFRIGQTGAAIGCAGIRPTRDWRGTKDLFGRILEVKNEGIADEIAGFANIIMGEGDGGTPIVILRGLELYNESNGIKELYRPEDEDVIRRAILKSRSI